jgi:hypothetical protein
VHPLRQSLSTPSRVCNSSLGRRLSPHDTARGGSQARRGEGAAHAPTPWTRPHAPSPQACGSTAAAPARTLRCAPLSRCRCWDGGRRGWWWGGWRRSGRRWWELRRSTRLARSTASTPLASLHCVTCSLSLYHCRVEAVGVDMHTPMCASLVRASLSPSTHSGAASASEQASHAALHPTLILPQRFRQGAVSTEQPHRSPPLLTLTHAVAGCVGVVRGRSRARCITWRLA